MAEYVECPRRKGKPRLATDICFRSCKEEKCKVRDAIPRIRVPKTDKGEEVKK